MKNSKIALTIFLLTNIVTINASRMPDLDGTYLFQSKEHIKKRLDSIGLIELSIS